MKVFYIFELLLDFLNDVLIGVKVRNENQKHKKGSAKNKVEIKRTMQKSKDVCDVKCFI